MTACKPLGSYTRLLAKAIQELSCALKHVSKADGRGWQARLRLSAGSLLECQHQGRLTSLYLRPLVENQAAQTPLMPLVS